MTFAFTNGEAASIVLGQTNFASSGQAAAKSGLDYPYGLTFDSSGNLCVTDSYNSKVQE
jgi:hypothetical protein